MSDKFFFKGRQDARQNHTKHSYKSGADQKSGTKKFPLSLLVTSAERKLEVESQLADAGLYAEITVDTSEAAVESIEALTALLNKGETVRLAKTPNRNDPCSCGSGKKFKKCCG